MTSKAIVEQGIERDLPGSRAGVRPIRTDLIIDLNDETPAGAALSQAWKWEIRKRIWDYMEENDIAR